MSVAEEICTYLDGLSIAYETAEHAPANTMADCAAIDRRLHALTVKNIFLTTKNQKRFYLCLTRPNARFHTADISRQARSSRLSFAPEDRLLEILHARPGSASPMGLIFESARGVELLVDAALRAEPRLAFHPCDNTKTLAMAGEDFFARFLPPLGVSPTFVEIHDFIEAERGDPGAFAPPSIKA